MSNDQPPEPADEEESPFLGYATPRLCRRYQKDGVWMSVVRVTATVLLTPLLASYFASLLTLPSDALVATIGIVSVVPVAALVRWERGMVLREPIWEGSKDLRATTWRASASRFDSSGVTIVDPHGEQRKGD